MQKQLLTIVILLLGLSTGQAQQYGKTPEDSVECVKRLSLYREFRDQENIEDALPHWRKAVRLCPKASKRLYLDGVDLYEHFIEKTSDSTSKQAYVDSLLWVYEQRIEHYGQEGYVKGKMGGALLKYRRDSELERAYELLKTSLDQRKEKSTFSALARYYFSLYYMYKADKVDKDKIIREYLVVSSYIEHNIQDPPKPKYKAYYEKAGQKIDKVFTTITKCEDIVKTFQSKLDHEDSLGSAVKKKMLSVLREEDCKENDLYPELAKQLHQEDPSAVSAYNIGSIEMKAENYEGAAQYFDQAIELAEDSSEKDSSKLENYYLAAAQNALKRGLGAKAAQYAKKVLKTNDKNGKAYIIIADGMAQSSESCGSNKFEKAAVYWVAADYLVKAKNVDPEVKELADKKIASYQRQFPSKSTLFDYGYIDKVGSTYTVDCWINETTTIRKAP